MSNVRVGRRGFLHGLTLGAGGVLLSPLLHRMEAHAAGVDLKPKRFVFVTVSNGINPAFFQPVGIDRDRKNNDKLHDIPLD